MYLDDLGTSIRSEELRWDDHAFNVSKEAAKCLGFLKLCKKYFTPSDLRTVYVTYIRPKMEYNSHLWAGASKSALDFVDRIESRALKLIGDDRVISSITSLRHRRDVTCMVLFYKYYFGKCSSVLSELTPTSQVFTRNTSRSGRIHVHTVAIISHRTTHYRENSFFIRTARLWNDLPRNLFAVNFNIFLFKASVNKHFLLSLPIFNLSFYSVFSSSSQCSTMPCRGYTLRLGFAIKKKFFSLLKWP